MQLQPVPWGDDPVERRDADGNARWVATTRDPKFTLEPAPGSPMPEGWYWFDVPIGVISGSIIRPQLFYDFGKGYDADSMLRLHVGANGIRMLIKIAPGVKTLRFDPTSCPAEWTMGGVTLTPVKKKAAIVRVLRELVRMFIAARQPGLLRKALAGMINGYKLYGFRGVRGFLLHKWEEKRSGIADEYADWIKAFDTLDDATREAIREDIAATLKQPLISIVMPTYNTPARFLEEAIASVKAQLYTRWELCIADDASSQPHVREILERHQRDDARIRVAFRTSNGHISACSNDALGLATGEYVALMDHDDVLPEAALYWVLKEINTHPDATIIYSDEDKLDPHGRRVAPYFKSDWNYDLFLSHNMISHLGVYRRAMLQEIGGFRVGYEGSQDYDLALRVMERSRPEQIRHIPRVLYHWRMAPGSTSVITTAKSYALENSTRAIQEFLDRRGIKAKVEPLRRLGCHRVRYALPSPAPKVSIIIPTRDRVGLLRQCIDSVREKSTYRHYEVIVIDNGSREPATMTYFDALRSQKGFRILRDDRPFNFASLNNVGAKLASGDVLLFLNNDIEVITEDWLEEMVSQACRPEVGAVGAKLYYPDEHIQHAGLCFTDGLPAHLFHRIPRWDTGYFSRASLAQQYSAVTGACMAVETHKFFEVGGFFEALSVAYNDVDLCLALVSRGYKIVFTPFAELYHHESATRGAEDTPEKRERFGHEKFTLRSRWQPMLDNDPYFSPNLMLDRGIFAWALPPRVDPPPTRTLRAPAREAVKEVETA